MLRNQFMVDMRKRFAALRRAITQLVVTEDAFGLLADKRAADLAGKLPVRGPVAARRATISLDAILGTTPTTNTRWRFDSDASKVDAYRDWLKNQVDAEILEVDAAKAGQPWTSKYIGSAYRKGVVRGYMDAHAASITADKSMDFVEGGKAAFLEGAFSGPVAQGKLDLLYTRAYSQLQGVAGPMDQEMSRILSDGLAAGASPYDIARSLNKTVSGIEKKRALTIARTEIIHAHAEGQLDSFQAMNIEQVGVLAEWSTAADSLVCPECGPLEGVILTIDEARGMLPRHPNCRCAWLPAGVGEHKYGTDKTQWTGDEQGLEAPGTPATGKTTGQVWHKDEAGARIRESIKAEFPKLSTKDARAATRWVGGDLTSVSGKVKPGSKQAAKARARAMTKDLQAKRRAAKAAERERAVAKVAKAQAAKTDAIKAKYGLTDADVFVHANGKTYLSIDGIANMYEAAGLTATQSKTSAIFSAIAPEGMTKLEAQAAKMADMIKAELQAKQQAAQFTKATAAKVQLWAAPGPSVQVLDAADYSNVPGWEKLGMSVDDVAAVALGGKAGARTQSYGVILFDEQGRVLMREPKGHYGGAHWTFAKGGGTNPGATALAELQQETGFLGEVHDILQGQYVGGKTKTNYFLGKAVGYDASLMDAETASVKWMTYDEAMAAIQLSKNPAVIARDMKVLEAAYQTMSAPPYSAFGKVVKSGQATLDEQFAAAKAAEHGHKVKLGMAQKHYAKPKFGGGVGPEDWVNAEKMDKLNSYGLNKVLSDKGWHLTTLPKDVSTDLLTKPSDLVEQKAFIDALKPAPKGTYMPGPVEKMRIPGLRYQDEARDVLDDALITAADLKDGSVDMVDSVLTKGFTGHDQVPATDKDHVWSWLYPKMQEWHKGQRGSTNLYMLAQDDQVLAAKYINEFKQAHPKLYGGVVKAAEAPVAGVPKEVLATAEELESYGKVKGVDEALLKGLDEGYVQRQVSAGMNPVDVLYGDMQHWYATKNADHNVYTLFDKQGPEAVAKYINEFKQAHPRLYGGAVAPAAEATQKAVTIAETTVDDILLDNGAVSIKKAHIAIQAGKRQEHVYAEFVDWNGGESVLTMKSKYTAQEIVAKINKFKATHPELYGGVASAKAAAPAAKAAAARAKQRVAAVAADFAGPNPKSVAEIKAAVAKGGVKETQAEADKLYKHFLAQQGKESGIFWKNYPVQVCIDDINAFKAANPALYGGAPLPTQAPVAAAVKAPAAVVGKPAPITLPVERDLRKIKDLEGSTKPYLAQTPDGKQWVVKDPNRPGSPISPSHLRSEMQTDDLYKVLGYAVPRGGILDSPGGPMKVTEFLEGGEKLSVWRQGKTAAQVRDMYKQIGDGFVADALFANHDVVGATFDNIFVVGGKAYRIDNGGGLAYRAQGGAKLTWTGKVGELKSMRDASTNANTAAVFAHVTDQDIQDQIRYIVGKRGELLAAVADDDVRAVLAARLDDLAAKLPAQAAAAARKAAPAGERRAVYGVTQDLPKRVTAAKSNGVCLAGDRGDIEDCSLLVWEEKNTAKQAVTKVQFKVTTNGSEKIVKSLGDELAKARATAPSYVSNVHPEDSYWNTILAAAKTVNHHATDLQYNVGTLQDLSTTKATIQAKLATATGDTKKMLTHYQAAIAEIEKAHANASTTAKLEQYVYTPSKNAPQPQKLRRAFAVRQDNGIDFRVAKFEDGVGTAKAGHNHYPTKEAYTIDAGDGIEVKFLPTDGSYKEQEGLALHGTVSITVPEAASEEAVRKALGVLKDLGVDAQPPSAAYEEALYLHRGVYINGKDKLASYQKIWSDPSITDEARVVKMKAWVKSNMDIDVDTVPSYDPAGYTRHADGGGFRHWERWDMPAAKVAQDMKDYALIHTSKSLSNTPHGVIAGKLDDFLTNGGEFTSTTGRIRKGISISETGGESPGADIRTGGANFFQCRVKNIHADNHGFYFKIENLSRQDAISYDHDSYARISKIANRRKDPVGWKTISHNGDNETLFKEGLSYGDLHFLRVWDTAERRDCIDVFHKHGIYTMPDGRAVEDIVVVGSQVPTKGYTW